MRIPLLIGVLFLLQVQAEAQQRFVSFDSTLPSGWTTSGTTPLALSTEHVKGGARSLKWAVHDGDKLTATNLAIPSSETGSSSASSAQIFIYSPAVSNDTLVFQFLDNSGNLKREGHMLLNYQGWREYHRSYRYDYNNGNELASFALNTMTIQYKAANAGTSKTIYIDEATLIGNTEARLPGPHLLLDYVHFVKNDESSALANPLQSWLNTPDIPATTPGSDELAGIAQVKSFYTRTLGTVTPADVQTAKNYVNYCTISRNTDGSITGRGLVATTNADTLIKLSTYCGTLARAYGRNNDTEALTMLRQFTEYLVDQGVAEGCRDVMPTNDYTKSRTFPVGFLEALPYYTGTLRTDVLNMLKWSNAYNTIYAATVTPGLNTDFLHVKSNFLVELALAGDTNDQVSRDLKSFSRYLEQFTYIGQGARDGIKPDGTGFHHGSHHVSYMYAFGTWITRAYELKGTPFRISNTAYTNMSFALKSLFLETSKGAIYSHSESGRGPFPSSVPVTSTNFQRFVQVGGDLINASVEPEMAALYNYIYKTNTYAVPAVNLDGFHQFNYAQLGVWRKNNWVATMRGFTDKLFGSEIYASENRYGRYQSYGSLEILYDGSLAATGYIADGKGWDWNMMPGTTTVQQSWTALRPAISGTASEYQGDAFAGALTLGNNGLFGMNFVQNAGNKYTTSNLKFRKSVFAFDSIMVCLGSGISSTNASDAVITTLFQGINASANPAIYINSTNPLSANYDQSLSTASSGLWLVNGQTTGFYIPQGNSSVHIFRGTQTTPDESSNDGSLTNTANASKAWLEHGVSPGAATYQYVVVPGTTPAKMEALSAKLAGNQVYTVLRQTDSLHVVKYIPQNLTGYVCFLPKNDINIGYLKSVSNRALVSIRESGDSLLIHIANPDLNTVANTSSTWVSTASTVAIELAGNWNVAENSSNAGISKQDNSLTATFSLIDGASAVIKLVKDESSSDAPGVWDAPKGSWNYDLGTGTSLAEFGTPPIFQQGSGTDTGTYSYSVSSASTPGFLPYPPSGNAKVILVDAASGSNGTFVLNSNNSIKMPASAASGNNKLLTYDIADASTVASLFFTIAFDNVSTNGTWIYAIGNHTGTDGNLFTNSSAVYKKTTELFTALQWVITASGITFNFRSSASETGGTYSLISASAFAKGKAYQVEIYCNNSAVEQSYTRGGVSYAIAPGKFQLWVHPAGGLSGSVRMMYAASYDIPSSGELVPEMTLNSYLFQGASSTAPYANAAEITLSNIQVNYAEPTAMPLSMLAFTGSAGNNSVRLNWQTAMELNTGYFTVLRSTDSVNFTVMGTVQAAGNSPEKQYYTFTDNSISGYSGTIYYRLQATDKDGTISYDHTIPVKLNLNRGVLTIAPNPVVSTAELRYLAGISETTTIRVSDLSGRLVVNKLFPVTAGYNSATMDLSALVPGMYLVTVTGAATHEKVKLIKQ
ncbi:T9SS type A sorting domain-containing protein [Pedobacter sp. BS3]|uniref:polysaccharide lyase family 8 super-sandwich domain-containing protein n=1 Tax=Pedobacter sp. BS3 TaxID=2567937 RepID=UPI0011EDCD30|nr:polysaccharide lyase family 8 super-sandwich domain-containing protein [Pedobacter sp. BS3]TZF82587.1 T9SS type A sorting domain-containing protein [Pedobacter sp. BS3]